MQSRVIICMRICLLFLFVITLLLIVYTCGNNVISSPPALGKRSLNVDSGHGYILSLGYSDQVTSATMNIMSLQCWAATVSNQIRVVEPFLYKGSEFGVALAADEGDNLVRMRDVFDVESWDNHSSEMGYAPIVTWKHFLEHAPQDLIIVHKPCPVHCTPKERIENITNFYKTALAFADSNGFKIIRHVNKMKGYMYTTEEFRELVYGGYSPNNTVILFNAWGGIDNTGPVPAYREGISDAKKCTRSKYIDLKWLKNSELIEQDAQHYREQYLDREYISVMFRSEHFAILYNLKQLSPEEQVSLLTKCVNGISEYVYKLKEEHEIDSVFLTVDCRKQGSNKIIRSSLNTRLGQAATLLYQQLYGNSSSLEDWDASFDKISSYKAPGYIAQLQKYLAASGTCLLTAGGGSFQMSAKYLYMEKHNDSSHHLDQC